MTCVIAYVYKSTVYMISDSCGSNGSSRNSYTQPKAFKLNNKLMIGFCDSFKNGQNLYYSNEFKKLKKSNNETVDEFVFNKVIPKIKHILEADDYTEQNTSEFIIAAYGRIFLVSGEEFSMLEPADNFAIIGSGHDIVNGILNYIDKNDFNIDIESNLIKIMKIVEKYFTGVQEPYNIIKGK